MAQRIKGQETEVMIVDNGIPQVTLTDVRSFELAAKTEMLEEGYLGETTDRYDEVYKGVRGRLELHFETQDIFQFFQDIIDRARRRQPGTQINIKTTLNFPNGQRPLALISNAFFGELPINFPSRSDYGAVTLDFQAADVQFITT